MTRACSKHSALVVWPNVGEISTLARDRTSCTGTETTIQIVKLNFEELQAPSTILQTYTYTTNLAMKQNDTRNAQAVDEKNIRTQI